MRIFSESIRKIEDYTDSLTKKKFSDLVYIQDAVLMRLAVIGESANKIPFDLRKKHKEIPWRRIIDLRNIIVHNYSSINIERIWKNIKEDLPKLKKQIEKLSSTT